MDELSQFQARLERALSGRSIEELLPIPRAVAGFDAAIQACEDVEVAKRAVARLREGYPLLSAERAMLEVAIRMTRPAAQVESDRLPIHPELRLEAGAREVVEALLPGVASLGWSWDIPFATAFQVAPRTLVTCGHVAKKLKSDPEDLARQRFIARFDWDGGRQVRKIAITGVHWPHDKVDVATLDLAAEGPLVHGMRLAVEPQLEPGARVLVVGYPIYSPGLPSLVEMLFEDVYGVKRASPGEVLSLEGDQLYHDCTTLPGSSGSPLFDVSTGLVVGVHASGEFAERNTAVSTRAMHALPPLRSRVAEWARDRDGIDGCLCPPIGRK